MFDPEKFGEAMGAAIREAVAPLQKRIVDLEAQIAKPVDVSAQVERAVAAAVAALPAPKDGKDAEPVDFESLVKQVVAKVPTPANGKDGKDGENGLNGTSITLADVQPMLEDAIKQVGQRAESTVAKAISEIPRPADGRDGTNGKDGERGEKGADGLGLAGAMIDRDGALQITLTNGEVKSLGVIVGKDGRDGASFETFEIEYIPESHEMAVKATAAGRTKELRYPAGGIRPAGYWRDGTKAAAGEAWVHDGSLWIAKSPTAAKPESRSEDWIIAARKGRDGERGAKGTDGAPPAPIKLKD